MMAPLSKTEKDEYTFEDFTLKMNLLLPVIGYLTTDPYVQY